MTPDRSYPGDKRAPPRRCPGPQSGREAPCLVPGQLGLFFPTPSGGQCTPNSCTLHHLPFMAAPRPLALFGILASQGRRPPPPPGRSTHIGFVLHSRPGRPGAGEIGFVCSNASWRSTPPNSLSPKYLMSQATLRQLALFYISAPSTSRHHRDTAAHGNWLRLASSAWTGRPRPPAAQPHHPDRKKMCRAQRRRDAEQEGKKRRRKIK